MEQPKLSTDRVPGTGSSGSWVRTGEDRRGPEFLLWRGWGAMLQGYYGGPGEAEAWGRQGRADVGAAGGQPA